MAYVAFKKIDVSSFYVSVDLVYPTSSSAASISSCLTAKKKTTPAAVVLQLLPILCLRQSFQWNDIAKGEWSDICRAAEVVERICPSSAKLTTYQNIYVNGTHQSQKKSIDWRLCGTVSSHSF